MVDYGLNGIDLDFEFPGGANGENLGPPGMVFSKSDTENLIAVFSDFRNYFNTELGNAKSYLLTLDVHSMPIWYLNKNQLTRLTPLLDWYNLMTYEVSVCEE